MKNEPISKSPAADLLLTALQELKEIKIEVTVNFKRNESMGLEGSPAPVICNELPPLVRANITKTEELLPPVLSPADIQKFLGIGKKQSYELLNSNQFHVTRVGRRILVSRPVFIEWLEGTRDDLEVKRRS